MEFARPHKVEEALSLLAQKPWRILAGGTDFYPGLRDARPKDAVLDITAAEGLREIALQKGFWSIGALATWTDIIKAPLPAAFDGLKLAAREVGSVQIQNRATVSGNICNASPAADGVPPLLTLDAQVEARSASETRRLPLSQFIRGNRQTDLRPDELVTRILVPESVARGSSSFLKLGARKYLVISISMVAVRLDWDESGLISEAAVSVGACSAVARRLESLEADLIGRERTKASELEIAARHLEGLQPIDDVRATADYRREASQELIRRTIAATAGGES